MIINPILFRLCLGFMKLETVCLYDQSSDKWTFLSNEEVPSNGFVQKNLSFHADVCHFGCRLRENNQRNLLIFHGENMRKERKI